MCKEYLALVVGTVAPGLHLIEEPLLHDGKARGGRTLLSHRITTFAPL